MMKIQKGDTLVEVLLAMAVFAVVMMIGLSTMNNGMSRALASLQLTMARNTMDSQAEALRFANTAYVSEFRTDGGAVTSAAARVWQDQLTAGVQGSATPLDTCTRGASAFVLSRNDLSYHSEAITNAVTYPRIAYGTDADSNAITDPSARYSRAEGVWVEKVHLANTNYYDFHIRACWSAPGSNVNTTLGTIVRLYDPRRN